MCNFLLSVSTEEGLRTDLWSFRTFFGIYSVASVPVTFTTLQLSCKGHVTEIILILQSSGTFSVTELKSFFKLCSLVSLRLCRHYESLGDFAASLNITFVCVGSCVCVNVSLCVFLCISWMHGWRRGTAPVLLINVYHLRARISPYW